MEAGSLPRASQFAFAVTSEKNVRSVGERGGDGQTELESKNTNPPLLAPWPHIGSLRDLQVRMHLATVRLSWNSGCFQEAPLFTPPFCGHRVFRTSNSKANGRQQACIPPNSCHCFFLNQLFSYFKYEWVLLSSLVTLPRAGGFRRETKGI